MILISACLAGVNCRYDGGSNEIQEIVKLVKEGKGILVCPEQLGGLHTPRNPSEIINGDGKDVLKGKAKVVDHQGKDVTSYFLKGAEETLKIAMLYNTKETILKARSPSCGKGVIYDGTFSSIKKRGDGVTTALLKQNGIEVFTEEEFKEYIKEKKQHD